MNIWIRALTKNKGFSPNPHYPFNPYITFEINDAYQDDINISVYNLLGNKIYDKNYNVLNNKLIVWNASDYDSGIYIVKFSNKKISFSKKITLLK